MKVTTSKNTRLRTKLRQGISSFIVIAIVLVVPIFSLYEFGHTFTSHDTRSNISLAAMKQRPADNTTLPAQLFQEPLVTVTFDDGFESIYKSALPLLQKYGIHSTQYIVAGNTHDQNYVSWDQVGQIQQAGHEIACHTMTHADLTTLNDSDLEYQVHQCKVELGNRFGIIDDFASPYGAQNAKTIGVISKYFDSQRNTNGDPTNGVSDADVNIADNFNRFDIIGVTVHNDTTIDELQKLIMYAKATNGWLVLTYHQADEGGSQYAVDATKLEQQFKYLSSTNVRIVTLHDALASTRVQNVGY